MAKKILLSAWAALNYEPPPSAWTLRQWVRSGQIFPAPEKVGKALYVDAGALRMTDSTPTGAMADFLAGLPTPPRRRR
jgi:hypothetical protein